MQVLPSRTAWPPGVERNGEQMAGSMAVVSAHAADFVWRAGGTIAKYVRHGWDVNVVIMSLGVRGESASLWRTEGQTYEEVARIRREEATRAAEVLGCRLHFFDLIDYPMEITPEVMDRLVRFFREVRPSIILTHGHKDPFNPDHPVVHQATVQARLLAGAAGVMPEIPPIAPPRLFGFEPHQTEMSEFKPEILVDITEDFETKLKAMQCVPTQTYLIEFHRQLAEARGYHARRNGQNRDVKYAEAFQSYVPIVTDMLP